MTQGACSYCLEMHWLDAKGVCADCAPKTVNIGWVNACESCRQDLPLICVECHTVVEVVDDDMHCPTCAYGPLRGWEEHPKDSLRARECSSCSRYLVLNKANICCICYVNGQVDIAAARGDSFALSIHRCKACDEWIPADKDYCHYHMLRQRECADCETIFTAHSEDQWQCQDCLPNCKGCSDKFVPMDRNDLLCVTCHDKKRQGICTYCDSKSAQLTDGEGWCMECSEDDYYTRSYSMTPFKCERCYDEEVMYEGQTCEVCQAATFKCPSCKEYKCDSSQIICSDCSPYNHD